jgi:hypothetical protein
VPSPFRRPRLIQACLSLKSCVKDCNFRAQFIDAVWKSLHHPLRILIAEPRASAWFQRYIAIVFASYNDADQGFRQGSFTVQDKAERVAQLLLASDSPDNVRSYLDRGRKYKASSDTFLKHYFLGQIEQWAAAGPTWAPLRRLYDIEAECSLRGLELPYEEAARYLDKLGTMIVQALDERAARPEEQGASAVRQ